MWLERDPPSSLVPPRLDSVIDRSLSVTKVSRYPTSVHLKSTPKDSFVALAMFCTWQVSLASLRHPGDFDRTGDTAYDKAVYFN